MKLREDIAEYLVDFEKRMKFISLMRSLIEYTYPEKIQKMFDDRQYLDNLIVAVLVYIKDKSLGVEEKCSIDNIISFLEELIVVIPNNERIDVRVLANYIMVDVLQNGGLLKEYLVFDSKKEEFVKQNVRLINENDKSYHLTDEALDFVFRTKEIESELDYSLTRFRMQEYMKRDNYNKALSESNELVSKIRSMKIEMDDFLLRCKEGISKIPVDLYEKLRNRIRISIDSEFEELKNIQTEAGKRLKHLIEAEDSGVKDDDMKKHREALTKIIENIDTSIVEQRKLIIKRNNISNEYRDMLFNNYMDSTFERLNFEKDIMSPLRKHNALLNDASPFLLFMLTKPELEKKFSLENFYVQQTRFGDDEVDEGFDIEESETDENILIADRITRFDRISNSLFEYMNVNDKFTLKEYMMSLSQEEICYFLEENAILQVFIALFEIQSIDIERWNNEEKFNIEPNGEFELATFLSRLNSKLLMMSKIIITKLFEDFDIEVSEADSERIITISNYEVEVLK